MKLTIFGATGKTGKLLCELALERVKGRQMIARADVAAYILDRVPQPEFGDDCVVLF